MDSQRQYHDGGHVTDKLLKVLDDLAMPPVPLPNSEKSLVKYEPPQLVENSRFPMPPTHCLNTPRMEHGAPAPIPPSQWGAPYEAIQPASNFSCGVFQGYSPLASCRGYVVSPASHPAGSPCSNQSYAAPSPSQAYVANSSIQPMTYESNPYLQNGYSNWGSTWNNQPSFYQTPPTYSNFSYPHGGYQGGTAYSPCHPPTPVEHGFSQASSMYTYPQPNPFLQGQGGYTTPSFHRNDEFQASTRLTYGSYDISSRRINCVENPLTFSDGQSLHRPVPNIVKPASKVGSPVAKNPRCIFQQSRGKGAEDNTKLTAGIGPKNSMSHSHYLDKKENSSRDGVFETKKGLERLAFPVNKEPKQGIKEEHKEEPTQEIKSLNPNETNKRSKKETVKEKISDRRSISNVSLLSYACQRRGFNPVWKQFKDFTGHKCDLILNNELVRASDRGYKSQHVAREAIAVKGLAELRKMDFPGNRSNRINSRSMEPAAVRDGQLGMTKLTRIGGRRQSASPMSYVPSFAPKLQKPKTILPPYVPSRLKQELTCTPAVKQEPTSQVKIADKPAPTGSLKANTDATNTAITDTDGGVCVHLPGSILPVAVRGLVERELETRGNNITFILPREVSPAVAQAYTKVIESMSNAVSSHPQDRSSSQSRRSRSPRREDPHPRGPRGPRGRPIRRNNEREGQMDHDLAEEYRIRQRSPMLDREDERYGRLRRRDAYRPRPLEMVSPHEWRLKTAAILKTRD